MVKRSRKIRIPTRMTSAPPATSNAGMRGRNFLMKRRTRSSARPVIRKGTPRPADQKARRKAPCITVAEEAARVSTAPRIGPRQGVQPMANAAPTRLDRLYGKVAANRLTRPSFLRSSGNVRVGTASQTLTNFHVELIRTYVHHSILTGNQVPPRVS